MCQPAVSQLGQLPIELFFVCLFVLFCFFFIYILPSL
ncbi:rCG44863, partial [Rattus norvegicus]